MHRTGTSHFIWPGFVLMMLVDSLLSPGKGEKKEKKSNH